MGDTTGGMFDFLDSAREQLGRRDAFWRKVVTSSESDFEALAAAEADAYEKSLRVDEPEAGYYRHRRVCGFFGDEYPIGLETIVNGRTYRIATVESDRPQHRVTDCSIELICIAGGERIVLAPDGHRSEYSTGHIWDTTDVPRDLRHWNGERGNRSGVRGPDPGILARRATEEEFVQFRAEGREVARGLVVALRARLISEADLGLS